MTGKPSVVVSLPVSGLDAAEYVEAVHRSGMLHGSTLSNVYAHKSMLKKRTDLKEANCRTVSGKTFHMDGGWYLGKQPFMCQNNPFWEQALVERAKRAIDAGTDVIVFDEPFGDTFFQSLPMPVFPGFSHDRLFWPLLLDAHPDLVGRTGVPADRAVLHAGGNLHKPRHGVIEELPVAFAEIALSPAARLIPSGPVLHTTATADIEVSAYEAFVT